MKYEYDAESDVLTIRLSKGKLDFGEQEGNVITHFDKEYKPVEIEILDASKEAVEMIRTILKAKLGNRSPAKS